MQYGTLRRVNRDEAARQRSTSGLVKLALPVATQGALFVGHGETKVFIVASDTGSPQIGAFGGYRECMNFGAFDWLGKELVCEDALLQGGPRANRNC